MEQWCFSISYWKDLAQIPGSACQFLQTLMSIVGVALFLCAYQDGAVQKKLPNRRDQIDILDYPAELKDFTTLIGFKQL